MVRRFVVGLALVASVLTVSPASAQAPTPSDSGFTATNAVMRVSLYRIVDGQGPALLADMRTHLVPIWEAQKQAGIIVNYSTMNNPNPTSPTDWQMGIVLTYKNYAALDSVGARSGPITLKHYGTAEARTAANEARNKMRTLISSQLVNATTYSKK
jgi:hypothetical protein